MLLWFLAFVDFLSGILLFLVSAGPDFIRVIIAAILVLKAVISFVPIPLIMPNMLVGFVDIIGGVLLYLAFEALPLPDLIKIVLIFTLVIKGIGTVASSASGVVY